MIASFGDKQTESLFHGRGRVRRLPSDLVSVALRKLDMLNAATQLSDLRVPPGNRLEKLKGNREGFHSIRVNEQWRLVFQWVGSDAHEVQIVDYHKG